MSRPVPSGSGARQTALKNCRSTCTREKTNIALPQEPRRSLKQDIGRGWSFIG